MEKIFLKKYTYTKIMCKSSFILESALDYEKLIYYIVISYNISRLSVNNGLLEGVVSNNTTSSITYLQLINTMRVCVGTFLY